MNSVDGVCEGIYPKQKRTKKPCSMWVYMRMWVCVVFVCYMNKIVCFLPVLRQVWGLSQVAHPGKFIHFSMVSHLWYRRTVTNPQGTDGPTGKKVTRNGPGQDETVLKSCRAACRIHHRMAETGLLCRVREQSILTSSKLLNTTAQLKGTSRGVSRCPLCFL